MILTYLVDPLSGNTKRKQVNARITTNHSISSYGQPVIVLPEERKIYLLGWG